MTPAPRCILCLLLVLLQVLSPWVHAHTGTEAGGFLHLPGLEHLAAPDAECAARDAWPDLSGRLIAVQPAHSATGQPRWGTGTTLPPPQTGVARPQPAPILAAALARPTPRPFAPDRNDSPPRAPPSARFRA